MNVCNCEKCCIFEAKPQIPPMEPIICTEPLDLVHIDYVSMEVTVGVKEKPVCEKRVSRRRLLYTLHPGICYKQPHGMHHDSTHTV